jgi:hypothetical protein
MNPFVFSRGVLRFKWICSTHLALKAQHSPVAWGSAPGLVTVKSGALKARITHWHHFRAVISQKLLRLKRAFSAWFTHANQFLGRMPQACIEPAPLALSTTGDDAFRLAL